MWPASFWGLRTVFCSTTAEIAPPHWKTKGSQCKLFCPRQPIANLCLPKACAPVGFSMVWYTSFYRDHWKERLHQKKIQLWNLLAYGAQYAEHVLKKRPNSAPLETGRGVTTFESFRACAPQDPQETAPMVQITPVTVASKPAAAALGGTSWHFHASSCDESSPLFGRLGCTSTGSKIWNCINQCLQKSRRQTPRPTWPPLPKETQGALGAGKKPLKYYVASNGVLIGIPSDVPQLSKTSKHKARAQQKGFLLAQLVQLNRCLRDLGGESEILLFNAYIPTARGGSGSSQPYIMKIGKRH